MPLTTSFFFFFGTLIYYDVSRLINESVTSHILTDYEEVLLLQEYFKANNLDQISPIITSEVTLTFKNKFNPDVVRFYNLKKFN